MGFQELFVFPEDLGRHASRIGHDVVWSEVIARRHTGAPLGKDSDVLGFLRRLSCAQGLPRGLRVLDFSVRSILAAPIHEPHQRRRDPRDKQRAKWPKILARHRSTARTHTHMRTYHIANRNISSLLAVVRHLLIDILPKHCE